MSQHECKSRGWLLTFVFFVLLSYKTRYHKRINWRNRSQNFFHTDLTALRRGKIDKQMQTCRKTVTAGCSCSDACFRQEVIPLNTTLACLPSKLEATVIKSSWDASDAYPPVSEKEQKSEWWRVLQLQLNQWTAWQLWRQTAYRSAEFEVKSKQ